ncbi:MAG: hypothetical protein HND48_03920 [Chloroflexi bacterium]|nr:hypothetical protein [Chloroflexota bacterium]
MCGEDFVCLSRIVKRLLQPRPPVFPVDRRQVAVHVRPVVQCCCLAQRYVAQQLQRLVVVRQRLADPVPCPPPTAEARAVAFEQIAVRIGVAGQPPPALAAASR